MRIHRSVRLPPDRVCPECGFDLVPGKLCGACGYDPMRDLSLDRRRVSLARAPLLYGEASCSSLPSCSWQWICRA
jgi:hypothetical protein